MTTPATNSKRKRTTDEVAAGSSASQEKKAKLRAPHFSAPAEMVTFLVGKAGSEEPFLVHKEFVCYYSPALRAAFNSSFVEGQTQTYRLEDISTNAFRLFVQWLYSQKMDLHVGIDSVPDNSVQPVAGAGKNGSNGPGSGSDGNDGNKEDKEEARRAQDLDLAQLWVVGDRLFIPSLQNAVILAWYKLWHSNDGRSCSTSWINYAYEHTCVGSHLRNLAVDELAYPVNPDEIKKHAEELPREMLIDLTLVYSKAVWPIDEEDDFQKEWAGEYSDKRPGSMRRIGHRYRCTRTWRNYLVPEDEG